MVSTCGRLGRPAWSPRGVELFFSVYLSAPVVPGGHLVMYGLYNRTVIFLLFRLAVMLRSLELHLMGLHLSYLKACYVLLKCSVMSWLWSDCKFLHRFVSECVHTDSHRFNTGKSALLVNHHKANEDKYHTDICSEPWYTIIIKNYNMYL